MVFVQRVRVLFCVRVGRTLSSQSLRARIKCFRVRLNYNSAGSGLMESFIESKPTVNGFFLSSISHWAANVAWSFWTFGPLSCNHFDFHLFKFVAIQFFFCSSLSSVFIVFFFFKLRAPVSTECGETIDVDETDGKGSRASSHCSPVCVCCGWQIVLAQDKKWEEDSFSMQIFTDAWFFFPHRQIDLQWRALRKRAKNYDGTERQRICFAICIACEWCGVW